MRRLLIATALAVTAIPGAKADPTQWEIAKSIGDLMLAQKVCSLQINNDSLMRHIHAQIPVDSMQFWSNLKNHLEAEGRELEKASNLEKQIFCDQARRVAENWGVVGDQP